MSYYKYNPNTNYPKNWFHHKPGEGLKLTKMNIQINHKSGFEANFRNVFSHYKMDKVKDVKTADSWFHTPMKFWQNQLNFAVWGASVGCGVGVWDQPASTNTMVASLYNFHVYFQIRRILNEMKVPLPGDPIWSETDNSYDRAAYERLCREFKVSSSTDWRQKRSKSDGLGNTYVWGGFRSTHYVRSQPYSPGKFLFNNNHRQTSNKTINIGWVAQGNEAYEGWSIFLMDEHSVGFTQAGVERLNDTIRTYVYCILTAQAQTRSSILGSGTAFNTQKEFVELVESSVVNASDLERRYEQVLKYARSKVDFVFGEGLYMAPSDMDWQLGGIHNFSNHVFISKGPTKPGRHDQLNAPPVLPIPHPAPPVPVPHPEPAPTKSAIEASPSPSDHENEKTALTVALVAIFLTVFAIR